MLPGFRPFYERMALLLKVQSTNLTIRSFETPNSDIHHFSIGMLTKRPIFINLARKNMATVCKVVFADF
jgi:hypothetical protein